MKTIRLTIPTWTAAVPAVWQLEHAKKPADGEQEEFIHVAGTEVACVAGDSLRSGDGEALLCLERMVTQGFAEEVD